MLQSFESYIDKTKTISSVDELNDVFIGHMKNFGMDKMILCQNASEMAKKPVNNFPQDWMDYYVERKFYLNDPGLTYRHIVKRPFYWAELAIRMELTAKQMEHLHSTYEAGLKDGICVPIYGPFGMSSMGLASSTGIDEPLSQTKLDLITAFCHHYHDTYYRLNEVHSYLPENIYLSPRQAEVMLHVINGKTDNDISDIMKISVNTVDAHLRAIYAKLGVNSRVAAVVKTLRLRLVNP